MQGIPMIASSPVRHDSPLNLQGLDVQTYQPPWKALSDFALHADLDSNGAINTHTPAFQQLVNQVGLSLYNYKTEAIFRIISFHFFIDAWLRFKWHATAATPPTGTTPAATRTTNEWPSRR